MGCYALTSPLLSCTVLLRAGAVCNSKEDSLPTRTVLVCLCDLLGRNWLFKPSMAILEILSHLEFVVSRRVSLFQHGCVIGNKVFCDCRTFFFIPVRAVHGFFNIGFCSFAFGKRGEYMFSFLPY